MVKKGLVKKIVAVASLATLLVSGSVMVYAAEYSRSIEFGDTWMNSRISASGQTAFAELTTGVESGMVSVK